MCPGASAAAVELVSSYGEQMSGELTWAWAREARRDRTGCPPWRSPSQACIIVLCGVTAPTALPVAIVVGTLLSIVNQGAAIADGGATPAFWLRVGFNFAVPFLVSSLGFLGAGRIRPGNAVSGEEVPPPR